MFGKKLTQARESRDQDYYYYYYYRTISSWEIIYYQQFSIVSLDRNKFILFIYPFRLKYII